MSDRNSVRTIQFMQQYDNLNPNMNSGTPLDNIVAERQKKSFYKIFDTFVNVDTSTLNETGYRDSRLLNQETDLIDRIELIQEQIIDMPAISNPLTDLTTSTTVNLRSKEGELERVVLRAKMDQLDVRAMLISGWALLALYTYGNTGEPNLFAFTGETCHILMIMSMTTPLGRIMARKAAFSGFTSAYQFTYTFYEDTLEVQYNNNPWMRGPMIIDLDLPTPFWGPDAWGLQTNGYLVNCPSEVSSEGIVHSFGFTLAPLATCFKYADIDEEDAVPADILNKIHYSLVAVYYPRTHQWSQRVRLLEMTGLSEDEIIAREDMMQNRKMQQSVPTGAPYDDNEVLINKGRMNHTYFIQRAESTGYATIPALSTGTVAINFNTAAIHGPTTSLIFKIMRKTEVETRRNVYCKFARISGCTLDIGTNQKYVFTERDLDLFFQERELYKSLGHGNSSYGTEHWQVYNIDFGKLRSVKMISGIVDLAGRQAVLTISVFNPGSESEEFKLVAYAQQPMGDTFYADKITAVGGISHSGKEAHMWGGYKAWRL